MPAPAPAGDRTARQVLLVLGMHRSGTSAVAGLLACLGGTMARTPVQPDADNLRGYWEPLPVVELNERLLAEAGSGWDDWGRLDPDRLAATAVDAMVARFVDEFGDATLAVLKDPRMCRLMPPWRAAFARLGAAPSVVLPLRHPLEVARSLAGRDGMPLAEGLLLWLRHVLDAEHDSRGLPRSFLRYEDLVAGWRPVVDRLGAELGLAWPVRPDAAAPAVEAFLSAGLRHHAAGEGEALAAPAPVAALADAARAALDDLAAGRDAGDAMARLDAARAGLDAADALMGSAARRQRRLAETARGAVAAQAAQVAALGAGLAEAEARADAERAARADEAAAARAGLAEAAARAAQLAATAAALEAQHAALLASTSWRVTAPFRRLGAALGRGRPTASAPQG